MASIRINAARLIDGVGENASAATVALGGTIESVEEIDASTVRAGAEQYTVLPGLVDAHVHLSLSGELFEGWRNGLSDAMYAMATHRNAQHHLDNGVTTVRDLGGIRNTAILYRNAVKAGVVEGPTIRTSGRWLCVSGGHGSIYGNQADGAAGFMAAAREELALGADLIKVMSTAGALAEEGRDPNTTELEPDEFAAIAAVAKSAHAPMAIHAHSEDAALLAIRSGAASIEHGTWLSDQTIDAMLEHGTALVPTLAVMDFVTTGDPAQKVIVDRMMEDKLPWLAKAIERGVKVVTGTDAGAPKTPHGLVPHEITRLVEVGMSPMDAIKSGTSLAGELVTGGDRGKLVAGAPADLVIVKGNPLDAIGAIRDTVCVIQGGKVVRGAIPAELLAD